MRDTRYKFPKETRKIGGKVYHYLEWRRLKSEAEKAAVRGRGKGDLIRIVPAAHGYAIYMRSVR